MAEIIKSSINNTNPFKAPDIPKQYWDPNDSMGSTDLYNNTVSNDYANNKRVQITDYNAKVSISEETSPIANITIDKEIEKSNILGDLDTKNGVFYDDENNTYTVVSEKDLGVMNIAPSKPGDKETIVKFADRSVLGNIKSIFLGLGGSKKTKIETPSLSKETLSRIKEDALEKSMSGDLRLSSDISKRIPEGSETIIMETEVPKVDYSKVTKADIMPGISNLLQDRDLSSIENGEKISTVKDNVSKFIFPFKERIPETSETSIITGQPPSIDYSKGSNEIKFTGIDKFLGKSPDTIQQVTTYQPSILRSTSKTFNKMGDRVGDTFENVKESGIKYFTGPQAYDEYGNIVKVTKPEKEEVQDLRRYADKSTSERLASIYYKYSTEEKRRDAAELENIEKEFQEETDYIETDYIEPIEEVKEKVSINDKIQDALSFAPYSIIPGATKTVAKDIVTMATRDQTGTNKLLGREPELTTTEKVLQSLPFIGKKETKVSNKEKIKQAIKDKDLTSEERAIEESTMKLFVEPGLDSMAKINYAIGKGAMTYKSAKASNSELSPVKIFASMKEEIGGKDMTETEKKYEVLKEETKLFEKNSENFDKSLSELEETKEYKENLIYNKAYVDLNEKYLDKGFTNTKSKYGEWNKDGKLVSIGESMPIEDQEMFKFLSSKIISNEAILKPDIDKIISEEEELKSNRTNLTEKVAKFSEAYSESQIKSRKVRERNPIKAWQLALMEDLASDETSKGQKAADVLRYGALSFGKVMVRDPIEFLVTAPVDVLKEDIKEGRIDQLKIGAIAPVSYLARGIYDPYTESSYKFNPDALSGALTVGSFGAGFGIGYTKTGTVQAVGAIKKATTTGRVIKGIIYGAPVVTEGFKYIKSSPEQRNIWQSAARVSGSYGSMAGYLGAGYVGSKVGQAVKTSVISNYDLGKGLRSGEVKIKMYSETKGKSYTEVKGVRNAEEVAKIADKGNVYIETPYGRYQIKTTGAYQQISGKDVWLKTSERSPGTSNKILNNQTKKAVYKMYMQTNNPRISDFESFNRILSSTHKSNTVTAVKNFYNQEAPGIKEMLYKEASGYTKGAAVYGTGNIKMNIRPVDAAGRPIGEWKSFANVDTFTFDKFFKSPAEFRKVIDAKNAIDTYKGVGSKGNTFIVDQNSKTGKYYFTPVRKEGDFIIKDIGINNIKKQLYYQGKVHVGDSIEISKTQYNRLKTLYNDPGKISNYLTKSQLTKTDAFYNAFSRLKNTITFDNSQSISMFNSKPTNINLDKYYFIGKTNEFNTINTKGLEKGSIVVRGDKLNGMDLGKGQVAFEVNTQTVEKVKGLDGIFKLTRKLKPGNVIFELGTPTKEFGGVSVTNFGDDAINLFGNKGVAVKLDKFYGRPGTEITDIELKKQAFKDYLSKRTYGHMSGDKIEKLFEENALTINPATGKVATTLEGRSLLQAKYGGVWSDIPISTGATSSPIKDSTIKIIRSFDKSTGQYIDNIGIVNEQTRKTTYLGMNLVTAPSTTTTYSSPMLLDDAINTKTYSSPSVILDDTGLSSTTVGAYMGETGAVPISRSIPNKLPLANTIQSEGILAGIQSGSLPISNLQNINRIPNIILGIGGTGSVLLPKDSVISGVYTELPDLTKSYTEHSTLVTPDYDTLQNVKSVTNTEFSNDVITDTGYESLTNTNTGYESLTNTNTGVDTSTVTEPVTSIINPNIPNIIPSTIPGTPNIPGIRIPNFIGGYLGGNLGRSSRSRTRQGRFTGFGIINPLADWRIYFKREFGYYEKPGVSKKIEVYNPSYKDSSDIGNVNQKIKMLTSPKLPSFIINQKIKTNIVK